MKKLASVLDNSINYITKYGKSEIECRYVRRNNNYISVYLSSHNGCKMGCKFCWLTQNNQTDFKHVTIDEYNNQLCRVLSPHSQNSENKNTRINLNFMARGEPLSNKYLVNDYKKLYNKLNDTIINMNFSELKMNVSTIMPHTINNMNLIDIFRNDPVALYYSIYTHNDAKKQKIMPNAMNTLSALDKIKEFSENKDANPANQVVFHGAFIENFNDNLEEIKDMANIIKSYGFKKSKFNIVRYNPHKNNDLLNNEVNTEKLDQIFEILNNSVTNKVKYNKSRIINRVGYDVYASCGMFVDK